MSADKRLAASAVVDALLAACRLEHGRAVFITANGVGMSMPAKAERKMRAVLLAMGGERKATK